VCLFASTAIAQFGTKGATTRNTTPAAEPAQKKRTNEKAHPGKAAAADQAATDSDLADALLVAMDTDHDGVVTKIEYREALKALEKVHKDKQGAMAVPDKAKTDSTATAPGADAGAGQGQGGVGAGANQRNDVMGRFTQMDANHDGVLSPNEVPQQMWATLREADVNRDGVIDAAEIQAFSRKVGMAKAYAAGVGANGAGGVQNNGRPPKQ